MASPVSTRSRPRFVSNSARTSRTCSSSSRTVARTARASRSIAIRRPAGWCKVSLHSPAAAPDWEGLGGELSAQFGDASAPRVRATHAVFEIAAEAEEAQAWLLERHPELTLMSAGRSIEIYKEAGLPTRFVRAVRPGRDRRQPRARAHPDGDREPGDHRALASVLDRPRPVPGAQRLAVEPQPPAADARARGDPLPHRLRQRGGGRLPDLAPARGSVAGAGARGRAWTISTGSTRSRSGRPTASRCCATRSPASRR